MQRSETLRDTVGTSLGLWSASLFRMFNGKLFLSAAPGVCQQPQCKQHTSTPASTGGVDSRKSLENRLGLLALACSNFICQFADGHQLILLSQVMAFVS